MSHGIASSNTVKLPPRFPLVGSRFPVYSGHLKSVYSLSRDHPKGGVGIDSFSQDLEPASVSVSPKVAELLGWQFRAYIFIWETCKQINNGPALSLSTWARLLIFTGENLFAEAQSQGNVHCRPLIFSWGISHSHSK